jgi:3-polyprenyl-4-hydroxybenzoate decarboxylase
MGYVIHPLTVSRIYVDKSLMTYFENFGTPISLPVVAWYVNADSKDDLIDTGATKECIDTTGKEEANISKPLRKPSASWEKSRRTSIHHRNPSPF